MSSTDKITTNSCLNCDSDNVEQFCPNCGQKAQATRQPLRVFLSDAVETLFNIDSRWFHTFRDLFLKPGKVTREYIAGKRASYLPPLRIYVSISVLYFLMVQWVDSSQVFFINFNNDDGNAGELGTAVQYGLFFLVPLFAWIISLFYRKRKAFYVEYLILAIHIHSIWFVLLMVELLTIWFSREFDTGFAIILDIIISGPAQIAIFGYLIAYLKRTFEDGWIKSFFKSFGIMTLYVMSIAALVAAYIFAPIG
ncbi:MAG: DUF3667 domain-containing protein [Balneolaceae bacterium]|nr:DUF3667 domain-containing protein [Balneolaceae bacterium]